MNIKVSIPENLRPSDPRFGVGPSLIPASFIDELKKTGPSLLGTSHRQSFVIDLIKEIQDAFKDYLSLDDDSLVVVGNGGASFLFDMIGVGLVKKKSAHFVTGIFSDKWFKAHDTIP